MMHGNGLQFVVDGVERMQRLIDDLLDYSRLESQAITFKTVDCNKVLVEALANLHASVVESGAVITSDGLPTISGNASQLLQLIQNLIGNAIKYRSKEPPTVHLATERIDGGWHVSCETTASGSPLPSTKGFSTSSTACIPETRSPDRVSDWRHAE